MSSDSSHPSGRPRLRQARTAWRTLCAGRIPPTPQHEYGPICQMVQPTCVELQCLAMKVPVTPNRSSRRTTSATQPGARRPRSPSRPSTRTGTNEAAASASPDGAVGKASIAPHGLVHRQDCCRRACRREGAPRCRQQPGRRRRRDLPAGRRATADGDRRGDLTVSEIRNTEVMGERHMVGGRFRTSI